MSIIYPYQKLSKFKTRTSKKGPLGIAEYTGSYVDGSAEASYLLIPSMVSHFFHRDPLQLFTKYIPKAVLIGLSTDSTFSTRCFVRGIQQDRQTPRPFSIPFSTTYDGPSWFIISTSRCIVLIPFGRQPSDSWDSNWFATTVTF